MDKRIAQRHLDDATRQYVAQGKLYTVRDGGITCHLCGMTSYNRDDIQEHYCGNCKVFLDQINNEQAQRLYKPHVVMWVPKSVPNWKALWWVLVVLLFVGLSLLALFGR